ncbi:hypothetical protein ACC685_39085, partial [Rhizobium ruizarguesonis]
PLAIGQEFEDGGNGIFFRAIRHPDARGKPRPILQRNPFILYGGEAAMNPRQTVSDIIGRPLTFYYGMRGAEKTARVK